MRRMLVAVALLGAMVVVPTVGAQAASGAKVTVVQATTYNAGGAPFPLTVCIDGTSIADNVPAGTTLPAETLPAGNHTIDFVQGTDCTVDPWSHADFSVIDGDSITLMSWWGRDAKGVSTFHNDEECIPAGMARITVRNAAAVNGDAPVSFLVTPQGGAEETVVSALVVGDQNRGEVPAGPYSSGRFTVTANGSTIVGLPSENLTNGEHQTLYLYGGNDGDIGYFAGPSETLPTCVVPTTVPTTTAPTTAPHVVAAATTAPHFTG